MARRGDYLGIPQRSGARVVAVSLLSALVLAAAPSARALSIDAKTFLAWGEVQQVTYVNAYIEAVQTLGEVDAKTDQDSLAARLRQCVFPENIRTRTVTAMLRDRARAGPQTEVVGPQILLLLGDLCR